MADKIRTYILDLADSAVPSEKRQGSEIDSEDATVRMVASAVADWESGDELYTDFSVRLVRQLKERGWKSPSSPNPGTFLRVVAPVLRLVGFRL